MLCWPLPYINMNQSQVYISKKYGPFYELACHPYAGAMLISIVPILVYVLPKRALT